MTRALGKEYDWGGWQEQLQIVIYWIFRSKSAGNLTQICSFYNSDSDPATETFLKTREIISTCATSCSKKGSNWGFTHCKKKLFQEIPVDFKGEEEEFKGTTARH